MRLVLVGLVLFVLSLAVALAALAAPGNLMLLPNFALSLVAFGVGAYGTWQVVDAIGWPKFATFIIIATFLIPYFRLGALAIVAVIALDFVAKAGYRITLWGKPRKKATAAV